MCAARPKGVIGITVAVIGRGYFGTVTAVCPVANGHEAYGVLRYEGLA